MFLLTVSIVVKKNYYLLVKCVHIQPLSHPGEIQFILKSKVLRCCIKLKCASLEKDLKNSYQSPHHENKLRFIMQYEHEKKIEKVAY